MAHYPELTAKLENAKAPHQDNVIYRTDDPTQNELSLLLTNETGRDLSLRGGAPGPEGDVNAHSPTTLYCYPGSTFTTDEFANLQLAADGWEAQYFADGLFAGWALSPQEDLLLANQSSVRFQLRNVVLTKQSPNGQMTIDFYNVGDFPNDTITLTAILQNPPHAQLNLPSLTSAFTNDNNTIYLTQARNEPVTNTLSFYLTNTDPSRPLVEPETHETNPPVFNLFFISGDGREALTSPKQMTNLIVGVKEAYGDQWKVRKHDQGRIPFWSLEPQAHEILGTGERSTVEFYVQEIVSTTPPGMTLMYLKYQNIPTYNEDFLSLVIHKKSSLITAFTASPSWRAATGPPVRVFLSWQVKDSIDSLRLSSSTGDTAEVSEQTNWETPQPPAQSTAFTLAATGPNGSNVRSMTTFQVIDFQLTSDVLGERERLTLASPQAIHSPRWDRVYLVGQSAQGMVAVTILDTASHTPLQTTTTELRGTVLDLAAAFVSTGSDRLYISTDRGHDYAFVVLEIDAEGKLTVVTNIRNPQTNSRGSLALSPDGRKVYFNHNGAYLDTNNFQIFGTHNAGLQNRFTQDLVLSPDGRHLYSIITLSENSHSYELYAYDLLQNEPGEPKSVLGNRLICTPDGQQVYIYGAASIAVAFPADNLRLEQINASAEQLVVSPNYHMAYATNPPNGTLDIIDTVNQAVGHTLSLPTAWCTRGLTVSPNGNRVYLVGEDGRILLVRREV
ncbi:MAG: hypothetical protein AAF840_02665 [Bacteroidota bacterium]